MPFREDCRLFGYIKPLAGELKVSEYEYYRGVYCGLCRVLGKCTGQPSRLALNYDLVFLALVRMAVSGGDYAFSRRRCLIHPLKKRRMADRCVSLEFCAYATAMLTAEKVEDNVKDSRGMSRMAAYALLPYGKMLGRRAKVLSAVAEKLSGYLSELDVLEREKCPSIDRPADLFGRALGTVCAEGLGTDRDSSYRVCFEIGYRLGRFIYILDAADDFADDVKSGSYNPIRYAYETEELSDKLKENLYEALLLECSSLDAAASLIDFSACISAGNIIKNIIELGMPDAAARVLGINETGDTTK